MKQIAGNSVADPTGRSPWAFLSLLAACCLLPAACVLILCVTAAHGQCPSGICPPPAAPQTATGPHPAVVRVLNRVGQVRSYGSGTLIHKDRQCGIVVTCWHLFRNEGVGEVSALFPDNRRHGAEVIASDPAWDLAALKIAPPRADPVKIAADYPRRGDLLTSCGYGPNGVYRCNRGRALGYSTTAAGGARETLELSGAARDGDSGGPVFDSRGELVAVLWGTDGRTVGGTYCGRIRKFLASSCPATCCPTPPASRPLVPVTPGLAPQIATLKKQMADLRSAIAAVKPTPGPRGPAGPSGPPGPAGKDGTPGKDANVDYDRLVNMLAGRFDKPITVQILDEHGRVIEQQEVRLGGVLQFQLLPRR